MSDELETLRAELDALRGINTLQSERIDSISDFASLLAGLMREILADPSNIAPEVLARADLFSASVVGDGEKVSGGEPLTSAPPVGKVAGGPMGSVPRPPN